MRVLFGAKLAALSKPRCGSTSLRRALSPYMESGDIKSDRAGESPHFHPHITSPYLQKVLGDCGFDVKDLTYIITMRHPIELLWSYWKFFKPDGNGRYSFSKNWQSSTIMPFENWVLKGALPLNPRWLELAPDWISPRNLSPLSLEARGMRRDGSWAIDSFFRVEEPQALSDFLSERLNASVSIPHVNASNSDVIPKLGHEAREWVRRLFPYESKEYGI